MKSSIDKNHAVINIDDANYRETLADLCSAKKTMNQINGLLAELLAGE